MVWSLRDVRRYPDCLGIATTATTLILTMEEAQPDTSFYLGKGPITWCSQKQDTVALSSCEAEFMAGTEAARQAFWLRDLLSEVTGRVLGSKSVTTESMSESP